MIFGKTKEQYFWAEDWTGQISLMGLEKFDFWRRADASRQPRLVDQDSCAPIR
jgi:hypothetical protein